MVTCTGKPINHKDLILDLLTAIKLPANVVIYKYAVHTNRSAPVPLGNHKANVEAKQAAI